MRMRKLYVAVLAAAVLLPAVSCGKNTSRPGPRRDDEDTAAADWHKQALYLREEREINGTDYTFTIDLTGWDGYTTEEQIGVINDLFWEVYPAMYERFGVYSGAATDVTLAIEDFGYEIACTSGDEVHLHDRWLYQWPDDYDCLTHEFAHVIQNGWDGAYLEYDSYIERFADYCRYVYAYDDGFYNDTAWTLQTIEGEPDRESSVRFLVWLDENYSSADNDIMLKYYQVCYDRTYESDEWDEAWAYIFEGTVLAGMTADEVFDMYAGSEFAYGYDN